MQQKQTGKTLVYLITCLKSLAFQRLIGTKKRKRYLQGIKIIKFIITSHHMFYNNPSTVNFDWVSKSMLLLFFTIVYIFSIPLRMYVKLPVVQSIVLFRIVWKYSYLLFLSKKYPALVVFVHIVRSSHWFWFIHIRDCSQRVGTYISSVYNIVYP